MDDKTLVERLRNLAEEWFEMCDDIHEPLSEAADTIEAQATRIEALEAALRNIQALAKKRQAEGGPDGNLKAIEGFAEQALESQP